MRRVLQIVVLIVAGEIVFSLPFHTARFFRPTLLDVFSFSNTDLGDIFAVYGITAMLAYFPGGVLADRFSARSLLCSSLILTAVGGFYMASIPGTAQMALLYGYWGVTSILLFWAALIRATREWGGDLSQGKAFGILEGGRGLVATLFAFLGVAILTAWLPTEVELASPDERRAAFSAVIVMYSIITGAVGVLAWCLLPESNDMPAESRADFQSALQVLQKPLVWAQAGIIVCAYCGYKGGDNYSLYAVQVLDMNEVDGARLAAYASYLRPFAAVIAGLLADRYVASRVLKAAFIVLVVSYVLFYLAVPAGAWLPVIYLNIGVSFFAVFALRGIYFALVQETGTPAEVTGTTVGVISFIGFTPEIFFAPITGRILDASPGLEGHQNYFLFLAFVALAGVAATSYLVWENKRQWAATGRLTPQAGSASD